MVSFLFIAIAWKLVNAIPYRFVRFGTWDFLLVWRHNGCVGDSGLCLGQGGIDRTCGCRCLSFWLPLGILWMEEIGRQTEDEFQECK